MWDYLFLKFILKTPDQLVNLYSFLFGGISVTNGDGVVFQRLKINRYTPGSAYFILSKIPFANISPVIPGAVVPGIPLPGWDYLPGVPFIFDVKIFWDSSL